MKDTCHVGHEPPNNAMAELEGITEEAMENIFFYMKSAIAMDKSFKNVKHTRCIMRHYHYVRE
jgi:hypothetical protein